MSVNDIITIEGAFGEVEHDFRVTQDLPELDFDEAMSNNRKVFRSTFADEQTVAISVWTTPKRTKTYPLSRVYSTLNHDGIKITIIPVLTDYGENGERGKIQPNTTYWMTALGVYVILGVFVDAERGEVGALAANANPNTESREGSPKFAQGQKFDLEPIQEQIETILRDNPDVNTWNQRQVLAIPTLLLQGIENYERLSDELDVPINSFERLRSQVERWSGDEERFLRDHERNSISAQNRETRSDHILEEVPGQKGKVNIDFGNNRKLYLTSDSMELNEETKMVTLLEGKNSSNGKFPSWGDMTEVFIKFMIVGASNFTYNEESYEKRLVCYLTGAVNATEAEFRQEFAEYIEECNANNIELQYNGTVIR